MQPNDSIASDVNPWDLDNYWSNYAGRMENILMAILPVSG
jgi:hypothetical protein